MRKIYFPILSVVVAILCFGFIKSRQDEILITNESRVADLFFQWTGKAPLQYIQNLDSTKIILGKSLVENGYATVEGKKSRLISKYFVCTDCHNQAIEDYDLANPNPEDRLRKSVKDNLPFLQGTTFFGMSNRESWYNQDYEKKYGSLVSSARDTLANAVQLCAKVCSSGRYLDAWELEAIMHYVNSIDYKISDLNLTDNDLDFLNIPEVKKEFKTDLVKKKFMNYSPATFLDITPKKDRKYGLGGDPRRGKELFVQSCLYCHSYNSEVSSFKLDTTSLSLRFLKLNMKKDNEHSIYNIVRQGTLAEFAQKAYMPHYTAERMSQKQLEDLVSYIMY